MTSRSGQSLIDVLIASALGALLLVGSLSLLAPSLKGSAAAERAQDTAAMARGLMDQARSLAASNWYAIAGLDRDTPYHLALTANGTVPVIGAQTVWLTSGLRNQFSFDQTQSTSILVNGVPGELSGTTETAPLPDGSCVFDGCWSFSDNHQIFAVPDSPSHNPTTAITITGWFYLQSYEGLVMIEKDQQYRLYVGGSKNFAFDYATSEDPWQSASLNSKDVNLETWHHVAVTYDGYAWRLYLNGTLDVLQPNDSGNFEAMVANQGAQLNIATNFNGKMDEVRMYDRALTPDEIQRVYATNDQLNGTSVTRSFTLANVNRNGSGAVVPSGGTPDPSTLAAAVSFAAPGVATRTMSTYLTRNPSKAVLQTDWSGGPGQGMVSTPGVQFASSTAINYLATTGSITADLANLITPSGGGNGSISSTTADHYAWNDIIGWINFYSSGTVQLTSQRLRGYANSSAGQISLDCATTSIGNICGTSNYYIANNGSGVLSGFAWNDTVGWISFNCSNHNGCGTSNYSVTVNPSTGVFSGFAWNDIIGWISFNGADIGIPTYRVVANWSAAAGYGVLDSGIINLGYGNAQANGITWTGAKPAGTDVRFQIATSNDSGGPWTYVGSDGTGSSYYAPESGASVALYPWIHAPGVFVRYRAFLYSDIAQSTAPRIDSVVIRWSP